MTGREFINAIENCNYNCKSCLAYHVNEKNRCAKVVKEKWQEWAKQQHEEFGKKLKEKI